MSVSSHISKTVCTLIVLLPWLILMAQTTQDVQDKVRALEQQAQKHLQEQEPQLAIPVLRAALRLQPGQWRIEGLLGIAQKRNGDPKEEAQIHLERAFSNLDEKNIQIEVGLQLIEVHAASGQLAKALAVAAKLEELAPQDPRVLFVTHQVSRQRMYQSLVSMMIVAPDSAEMHMIMAGEHARQWDQAKAIAQYREAIRLNPMLPGAHLELAEQLRTSSDPALNAQAEDEFKTAIQMNPYDEMSWRQLGAMMAARSDFKTAEEYYRKALALRPTDSEAKTGLAIVLTSMDQRDEAIPLLESAVKDDPSNVAAHFRLSGLYRRAGRAADAQRELDAFHHYQEVKNKLGKVFKEFAAPPSPM